MLQINEPVPESTTVSNFDDAQDFADKIGYITEKKLETVCYLNMIIKDKDKSSLFSQLTKLVKEAQVGGFVVAGDPAELVGSIFLLLKGLYLSFLLEKHPDVKVPSLETVMQLLRKPTSFSRQIL